MGNTRLEHVEKQALYCKSHMRQCKEQVAPFINAQIENANEFYKKLAKTEKGRQKIAQIKRL